MRYGIANETQFQVTPTEAGLVDALQVRFSWPLLDKNKDPEGAVKQQQMLALKFSKAMRKVYAAFPTDDDVACFYAERYIV